MDSHPRGDGPPVAEGLEGRVRLAPLVRVGEANGEIGATAVPDAVLEAITEQHRQAARLPAQNQQPSCQEQAGPFDPHVQVHDARTRQGTADQREITML